MQKTTAMFPKDKNIEIFSICDDFSKVFDKTVDQNAITACDSSKKRKYPRQHPVASVQEPANTPAQDLQGHCPKRQMLYGMVLWFQAAYRLQRDGRDC